MKILKQIFLIFVLNIGVLLDFGHSQQLLCPGTVRDGVYSFTVNASLPVPIPVRYHNVMYVQFDSNRGLPISTTTLHNEINMLRNFTRQDDFRRLPCPQIFGEQTECENTYRMTPDQQNASGRTSYDRGHMSPANPYRYTEDALSSTFYCINIAPQDPHTNQQPWVTVESKANEYFANKAGYVMTGLCDQDDVWGPTLVGYRVPACYWKLICYVDTLGETQVVGFIANNTILHNNDVDGINGRRNSTTLPRGQQEILDVMFTSRISFIMEAWDGAQTYLLWNRNETRAPIASECKVKRTITTEVKNEWSNFIQQELEIDEFY